MILPNKVSEAIRRAWGIPAKESNQVELQELTDDWIVWRREDAGKAGGLRLVVPKRGSQVFEIPASAFADDKHGVSWEYEISLLEAVNASHEAAKVLERHTGLTRVEAFRFLRSQASSSRTCFIAAPLTLRTELQALGVNVQLLRPEERGGYL